MENRGMILASIICHFVGHSAVTSSLATREPSISDDACPHLMNSTGLTGEDLYKALVQNMARSEGNVIETYLANHISCEKPGFYLNTTFGVGRTDQIMLRLALNRTNISFEQCIRVGLLTNEVIDVALRVRNDVIALPAHGGELTGEDRYRCALKREGQATSQLSEVGENNANVPNPGRYLSIAIESYKAITQINQVLTNKDTNEKCIKALFNIGSALLDVFRSVTSDQAITDTFSL